MSTPFRQQVYYTNHLKQEYGNQLEEAMIADLMSTDAGGRQYASRVLANYFMNNSLDQETNPKFYQQFEELGGDPVYLKYATQCFKKVANALRQGNL